MSTFSKPFLRVQAGIAVKPDNGAFSTSPVNLSVDLVKATNAAAGYAARIIFGANAQTATLLPNGTITPSAAGVRQVESIVVNPPAGATSNGNLVVTVTVDGLAGSPLAIPVALRASTHNSSAKVSAAIRDALNNNAAFAAKLEALETGTSTVRVRAIYPAANDASFNIAIAAGLGITAAASSTNTTAGAAGVVIERLGGPGEDALGAAYPAAQSQIVGIIGHVPFGKDYVVGDALGTVDVGDLTARSSAAYISSEVITAEDAAALDIFVLTR